MLHVIVVDDDLTNVQLLQMLLELDGFSVAPCTTIEDAMAAITPETNAFVIDWHLERNVSGLELLKAVRDGRTETTADAFIVMTSGDHRRESEALAAGANHFLLKPYPPDELSNILQELISGGGA